MAKEMTSGQVFDMLPMVQVIYRRGFDGVVKHCGISVSTAKTRLRKLGVHFGVTLYVEGDSPALTREFSFLARHGDVVMRQYDRMADDLKEAAGEM